MSLDWDATEVKDLDTHFPRREDGGLDATLQSLIWFSMPCGYSQIRERDIDDLWFRIDAWQTMVGPMFHMILDDHTEPVRVTKFDLRNAVGLRTNASRLTVQQFAAHLRHTHIRINNAKYDV